MMGLDEMGEMEIPAHLLPGGGGGMGGGMSEEDMINAAIQASLQDMSLNDNPASVNRPDLAQPTNQISQESYNFLNAYAGGNDASSATTEIKSAAATTTRTTTN